MNILIYSWFFFPSEVGGLEKYLYNLIFMLKKNHKIVLLTSSENNVKIEGVKIYHIYSLKSKIKFLDPISQIVSILILLPIIIIKEKISLVSAYVPTINSSLILLISKLIGLKNNINIRGYRTKFYLFRRIINDIGLFFTKNIFINSKDFKERYTNQSFLPKSIINKKNWIFIPNGINPNFWKEGQNFQNKQYDLIFVGKINKKARFDIKGIDILYKAIEKIYIDHNLKLKITIIGPYDKKLIKTEIPKVDFSYFDFKGVIFDRKILREYYKKSKLFILPSRNEGMPNSLMEAMASGVSCIASNVGAIPELIDNNINGLIFENENVSNLSELILKLLNNSNLRERLGNKAKEKINHYYSWQHIIQKIENYYKIL